MKRTICVVTTSRADYGLLRPIMASLHDDPAVSLKLIVTGSHLSDAHGSTVEEINEDGFPVAAEIPLDLTESTPTGLGRACGDLTRELSVALATMRPDLLLILGDRFELLSVAQAALLCGVPVAHVAGGDVTEGALDDSVRHAVTKLSHVHLVATEESAVRVRQLGEEADRVHVVGAMGVIAIRATPVMDREAFLQLLGWPTGTAFLLATYHPETLGTRQAGQSVTELLGALDSVTELHVLFTGVNIDPGADEVGQAIDEWCRARSGRATLVASLGQRRYASALRHAVAVVGNSSSGLMEAPSTMTPTVNIGDRQAGRARGASVIDVPCERTAIANAITKAVRMRHDAPPEFYANPYDAGETAAEIAALLRDIPLDGIRRKRFVDRK
jgi:UDP-N-acetylglucosamine 2-epimerase (non-hydrolysing)